MQLEDLVLVSVDDHVVEPPDLFERHLPDEWRDVAPRMVTRDDGTDVWQYDGKEIVNIGLNAVAGRPPEEYGMEPTSLREMRAGCYDIHERVRDMDANGVLGSMCFPSFPNFCGQLFARAEDKDAALAMVKAYNDWHVDEWCGTLPRPVHPADDPAAVGSRPRWPPRCAAWRPRAATRSRSPRTPRSSSAEHALRPLGSVLAGVLGRGHDRVPAHRLVVVSSSSPRRTRRSTC